MGGVSKVKLQSLQLSTAILTLLGRVGSDTSGAASSHVAVSGTTSNAITVTSIEGGTADLPCDIAARENDSVYLVLWYRQDSGTPIYRYYLVLWYRRYSTPIYRYYLVLWCRKNTHLQILPLYNGAGRTPIYRYYLVLWYRKYTQLHALPGAVVKVEQRHTLLNLLIDVIRGGDICTYICRYYLVWCRKNTVVEVGQRQTLLKVLTVAVIQVGTFAHAFTGIIWCCIVKAVLFGQDCSMKEFNEVSGLR